MSMVERFRQLHTDGLFVMPNAWDAGSARLLEAVGFPALATTSSGHAASLGRADQRVTREELLAYVEQVVAAVDVPVSVDAEACFPGEPGGVTRTVELIASAGAAGVSIEDYLPGAGLLTVDDAVERVHAVVTAAEAHCLVVTARAENHLYGVDDIDDTIVRLVAYHAAGADVVYAPGLNQTSAIAQVVEATGAAVNVLAASGVPPVSELARLGVRRVSTGGSLAWVAYGALVAAAQELLEDGTTSLGGALTEAARSEAFADRIAVLPPS